MPLRALIFDSYYDQFRGVISSIRVSRARCVDDTRIRMMRAGTNHELEEIGIRTPEMVKVTPLGPGEVGYVVASIRDVGGARSGETITEAVVPRGASRGIPGPQADGVLWHLSDRRRRPG